MKSQKAINSNKTVLKSVDPKTAIKKLIATLKVMYYNQDPMLDGICDFQMLYSALCDLDEIVGMYEIKKSIADQIKFLLVNYVGGKSKFEGHMLNTVIFGPPGCGKTTVSVILANIWNSLGLINKKTEEVKPQIFSSFVKPKARRGAITFINKNKPELTHETPKEPSKEETKEEAKENISPNVSTNYDDILLLALISLMTEKEESKMVSQKENKEKQKMLPRERSVVKYSTPLEIYEESKQNNEQFKFMQNQQSQSDTNVYNNSNFGDILRHKRYTNSGIKNIKKNMNLEKMENFKKLERLPFNDNSIKIVSRPDFVGQYVGHTCDRTKNLLTETLKSGKVLFIDEAYSLVLDEKDSFGNEAVNELNRFLSENPNMIVILAGYKNKLESSVFRSQPGMKRRMAWEFEIKKYTGDMLTSIFIKQLAKENWTYEGELSELNKFFDDNISHFECFGGDVLKMVFYVKLIYSELKFDFDSANEMKPKTINYDIFNKAYENMYCVNKPKQEINQSYLSMFC